MSGDGPFSAGPRPLLWPPSRQGARTSPASRAK